MLAQQHGKSESGNLHSHVGNLCLISTLHLLILTIFLSSIHKKL